MYMYCMHIIKLGILFKGKIYCVLLACLGLGNNLYDLESLLKVMTARIHLSLSQSNCCIDRDNDFFHLLIVV